MAADGSGFTAGWDTGEIEWALKVLAHRDDVVWAAIRGGMSKSETHRRSGLSRTTIDVIISRSPRSRPGN